MVPGLEDARVREAVVLADEAADVVGAGDDVRVAGGGKGVLVFVVHGQADLLAGDPCEKEEGKVSNQRRSLPGRSLTVAAKVAVAVDQRDPDAVVEELRQVVGEAAKDEVAVAEEGCPRK